MSEKYNISIWKDIPKKWQVDETNQISYIDEEKIADIGSNTMTSLNRAIKPQLINNVNGTNNFSFTLYISYIDTKTGEKVKNPFVDLISNESKIKVFWKDKWYDFIVKNIQESSSGKSIQYNCIDLYINELSKTGFNLEFSSELNNNQGTVQELANIILEDSDWTLDENEEIIQQEIEEPVYELFNIELPNQFTAKNKFNIDIQISAGSNILLYYSVFRDKQTYLQFFYNGKNSFDRESSDLLTEDGECLYVKDVIWKEEDEFVNCYLGDKQILHVPKQKNISTQYRAKRLVYSVKSKFDPITEKYVTLYDYNGTELYKYIENEYLDPTVVQNALINSQDFSDLEGWISTGSAPVPIFKLYPKFTDINITSYSYLKVGKGYYYNTAFQDNTAAAPEGFQPKQKFIFRIQAFADSGGDPKGTFISNGLSFFIGKYIDEDKSPSGSNYFDLGNFSVVTVDGEKWLECTATCNTSVLKSELVYEHIGFFLNNTIGNCWIKKIQFFPLVYGEDAEGNETRINPGDLDLQALIRKVYKYYSPSANSSATNIEEIKFLYVDNTDWIEDGLIPKYNENFEKIRSITEKNSTRFNLIQTLAETFECWARFNIGHNNDGSIIKRYDSTKNKVIYDKTITFVKEIGQKTGIGFKYGIDLSDVQRTINSEQIATKIIVSPNSNEFAENGFCTIARSQQNYSKENFILNFDYYISHGLLDGGELNKDLYLTTPDVIGYYYHLNQNNSKYDANAEKLLVKRKDLIKQDSFRITYEEYITSAQQRKQDIYNDLLSYTGTSSWKGIEQYFAKHPDDDRAKSLILTYSNLEKNIEAFSNQLKDLKKSIDSLTKKIEELESEQESLIEKNKALHYQFNNKYSRYIQEGSWISEEYIDDDLYYMDGISVAYTSSRPQVSYNISVLRLSALEKFKNKIFNLGDISYIEDTEFFGYVNGTPYKELVLISQLISNFDEPTQDRIVVQNYRTQFEDLFQRITATTQSLQYNQGSYNKVTNAFEEDGTIKVETLQNSIAYNQELIYSAQNESLITDNTGITLTDINNPNKKTKITSGGIFISIDGGNTWKNAIRGEGISTQYLTAGSINANYINILDGNHSTFRWDSRGINAFSTVEDAENNIVMVNLGKFVRFDRYGIYGINGNTDYNPSSELDIWNTANFGMTWKGFFIKNRADNGWVEVSSENDVSVFSKNENNSIERIKIGRIDGDGSESNPYIYGIKINNASGVPVMESSDDGELWLKKALNISSTNNNYSIQIGYLDLKENETLHRTIDINNKFIVYEDGSMVATDGKFTGIINAIGGTIGGLEIDSLIDNGTRFEITSSEGLIVDKDITTTILTAHAYLGETDVTDSYIYNWYVDNILKGTGENYTLSIENDITKVYFEAVKKEE